MHPRVLREFSWAVAALTGLRAEAPHARWRAALKLAALAALLIVAPWAWLGIFLERAREMMIGETPIRLLKFVAVFGLCLASIAIAPFLADRRVRFATAAVMAVGVAIDRMVVPIFGLHYSLDLSLLAWIDRANAAVTLPEYSAIITRALLFAGAIGTAFALAPPARLAITSRYAAAFVATTYIACAGLLWGAKSTNYDLPAPVAWPAIAVQTLTTTAYAPMPLRQDVSDALPGPNRRFRHIVFIVDESVRGDRLSLNNPTFDTTPFLASRGPELVNFGVATSGTNCSNTSRMIMRFGARADQLPDTADALMRKPTLWHYAKKAGYRTVHIDPFRLVGNFHSGMTSIEAKQIDQQISVATLPFPDQDPAIARLLPDLLERKEPSFIYINKNGVHPVFDKQYPASLAYEPSGLDTLALDDTQRAVIRHYHRSVRWSVDTFFKDAWRALTAPDVLTVYTADHGLALFEGGLAATHCTFTQTAVGEGLVPLFVVTTAPDIRERLAWSKLRQHSKATHFHVFPTLLWSLGYPETWIAESYGPTLFDPKEPTDDRRFWTGPLVKGGPQSWVKATIPKRIGDAP